MSVLFWKRAEVSDTDVVHEPATEVNEQHPLPTGIFWTHAEGTSYEETGEGHPFPTQVLGLVSAGPKIYTAQRVIPDIAAAAAFVSGDQFGGLGEFATVPSNGIIRELRFLDFDDEGIDKQVWMFSSKVTLAADNAAFSLADQDLRPVIGIFAVSTWRDAVNGQIGLTSNTPCYYSLPAGSTIYFAVMTLGADNIAAGSMPELGIVIEVAS